MLATEAGPALSHQPIDDLDCLISRRFEPDVAALVIVHEGAGKHRADARSNELLALLNGPRRRAMFGVGEHADLRADMADRVSAVLQKSGPSQPLEVAAERTIDGRQPSSRRDKKEGGQ